MTRTTLRHALLLATAATGASLGITTTAEAASPVVMTIHPGIGGPKEKDGGAGSEQSASAVFVKDGKQYLVTVYMSSNVSEEDRPWQGMCTSVLMDPILGPLVVVDQKQLSTYGGSRPWNHGRIATNGEDLGVIVYGNNEANGNTRTYAHKINEMCELEGDRIRISENNNQNEGAPEVRFVNKEQLVAGYLSTANNDLDASYAVGLTVTSTGVEKTWHTKVVAPSNIGRPAIERVSDNRVFFCASQGNNRPPEDGVACAMVDAMTGEVLHNQIIAKSDPANNVYFNQPSIAKIGTNLFAVQVLASNGLGKKLNQKGSNEQHLYAFKVSDSVFTQEGYIKNVGKYPTHSAICSGSYGESGKTYVAVVGASPTGLGQPSMQLVEWNVAAFKVNTEADNWTMGFYGDSGLIANLYGHNPNTQGRDFLRCVGDVKNPGFGVANGFMSDVETFFVAPHHGNIPGDPKNAGFLSFIPGKVAQAAAPQPPKEQPKKGSVPIVDPNNPTDSDPPGGVNPEENEEVKPIVSGPQGAACSIPSSSSSSGTGLAFLALGIGALFAARRRK